VREAGFPSVRKRKKSRGELISVQSVRDSGGFDMAVGAQASGGLLHLPLVSIAIVLVRWSLSLHGLYVHCIVEVTQDSFR